MGPEDQNLYRYAQAHQRPAGGAHYEQEEYEMSRPETSTTKGGYSISVRSASDDESTYGHARINSDNSDMSVAQGKAPMGAEHVLAVPARTQRPNERAQDYGSSRSRTGKSPLARRSFVRSAADLEPELPRQHAEAIEMRERENEQRLGLMDPRARSTSPPSAADVPQAPPEAHEEVVEEKSKKQRNRLSKPRPGSSGSKK